MFARWTSRHGQVFRPTPGLVGYVQNRLLSEERARLGPLVCSETWFLDRDTERAAFASSHYHDHVVPDEGRFLDRGAAWAARIVTPFPWPDDQHGYRVVAFGASSSLDPHEHVAELDRVPPGPGIGRTVRSWWTPDRVAALRVARRSDGFAFACVARCDAATESGDDEASSRRAGP